MGNFEAISPFVYRYTICILECYCSISKQRILHPFEVEFVVLYALKSNKVHEATFCILERKNTIQTHFTNSLFSQHRFTNFEFQNFHGLYPLCIFLIFEPIRRSIKMVKVKIQLNFKIQFWNW